MNKKFYFGFVAVAFALVFGLGALNTANAVPGTSGDAYNLSPGQANQFGVDRADNAEIISMDRDSGVRFAPEEYGLLGTSRL
jgi:hypothetical protein